MSQQNQKKILIESIKQSMIKPPTATVTSKNLNNKKPENYDSYLNTAIDYYKNNQNTAPFSLKSVKKPQLIYNLDSDDSPKEDQYQNNQTSNTNDIDEDMMKEIEMEIMRETNVEECTPIQRKIVKPVGPKRKINQSIDSQDAQIEKQILPIQTNTRAQKTARGSTMPTIKNFQYQEEQQKLVSEEEEDKPKRTNVPRKTCAYKLPQTTFVDSNPVKRLKQTLSEKQKPVKFSVDIKLLKGGLQIERIFDIKGSTREDITYMCRSYDGQTVQLNNLEMIHLQKDVLIDYYQNILFTDEQAEEN